MPPVMSYTNSCQQNHKNATDGMSRKSMTFFMSYSRYDPRGHGVILHFRGKERTCVVNEAVPSVALREHADVVGAVATRVLLHRERQSHSTCR